jgi:hypothetical protein
MADVLYCPKILDDMVKVAMVTIRWVAAFGAGEGYSCHDVGSALGQVEQDA